LSGLLATVQDAMSEELESKEDLTISSALGVSGAL